MTAPKFLLSMLATATLTGAAMALGPAGPAAGGEPPVTVVWRGDEVPAEQLRGPVRAAISDWSGYASETGSVFWLSEHTELLAIVPERLWRQRFARTHTVELAEQTCRELRPLLPATDEPRPAVLIGTLQRHYASVLARIGELAPEYREWAMSAQDFNGFIVADHLTGAWLEDPGGDAVSDWRNDIVHRTTDLLIQRTAKHAPDWLRLGLAWHMEERLRGDIRCMHRSGFVAATAHTGWHLWLKSAFKRARRAKCGLDENFDVAELWDWSPSRQPQREDAAYLAFGVARFLAQECPQTLPRLLANLHEAQFEGSKTWIDESTWQNDPSYCLPADEQRALLEDVRPDFFAAVSDYFRRGKCARRPVG